MGVCVAGNIICGFANLLIQSGRDSGVGLVFFGLLVIFGAYMTLYSTMESMWQKAKSAILRDNFNAYLATLFFIFLSSLVIVALINGERSDGKAVLVLLCLVVWIVCLIYNIYLRYQIYKEVAYITNQPLFVVAFWCGVTIILLPIAFIVYIIAWIGVREIRQSLSAGR